MLTYIYFGTISIFVRSSERKEDVMIYILSYSELPDEKKLQVRSQEGPAGGRWL